VGSGKWEAPSNAGPAIAGKLPTSHFQQHYNQNKTYMKYIKKVDRPESTSELLVVRIDGAKTPTLKKFYRKMLVRLKFPDYFGDNLDALADMLCDLSWLEESQVRLYIKNPQDFLSGEKKSRKNAVLEIFAEAASNQMEEGRTFMVRGAV